jgi:hypothetical protein
MLLLLNCFPHCNKILRAWKPPTVPFSHFSLTKRSLCNCTIRLCNCTIGLCICTIGLCICTVSLRKCTVSLFSCTISLHTYIGAYVNRCLIVYQQLHCAVFSDSYILNPLALYLAHWNYWKLYNFRISYWLNSIWAVTCLYSTVANVTVRISASFCTVMR